ncbi:CoA transferase [Nocardia jiangxiensis]|uniref:CoA transferase n=1 Tax=Nocardia jiangxiensis TaxID=282685 RepID=A0ABW6RQX7_9NOCA|nr:CoA transferase [Nocardia jiangxiensis]
MRPDEQPSSGRGEGPLAAANSAALHIVSALYRRSVTGVGSHIDVSGADALLLQTMLVSAYELNRDRIGDAGSLPLPENGFLGPRYRLYDTADGYGIAFTCVGTPALVDGQEFSIRRHAPALGEHTAEVLAELESGEPNISTSRP